MTVAVNINEFEQIKEFNPTIYITLCQSTFTTNTRIHGQPCLLGIDELLLIRIRRDVRERRLQMCSHSSSMLFLAVSLFVCLSSHFLSLPSVFYLIAAPCSPYFEPWPSSYQAYSCIPLVNSQLIHLTIYRVNPNQELRRIELFLFRVLTFNWLLFLNPARRVQRSRDRTNMFLSILQSITL